MEIEEIEENEPILELKRFGEDPRQFYTVSEIVTFLNHEIEFWKFAENIEKFPSINSIYRAISTLSTNFRSTNAQNGEPDVSNFKKNYESLTFNLQPKGHSPVQLRYLSSTNRISSYVKDLYLNSKSLEADYSLLWYINERIDANILAINPEGYILKYRVKSLINVLIQNNEVDIDIVNKYENAFKDKFDSFNKDVEEFQSVVSQKKETYDSHFQSVSEEIKAKKDDFESQADTLLKTKQSEFDNILNAFTKQLELKGPATYWKHRSTTLAKQKKCWIWTSIAITVCLISILFIVFYNIPEYFKVTGASNNVIKISSDSIKGSLILLTIVSIAVYLLRMFVKLAMSSYHLQLDAEERLNLTMVYLALIKEGGADPSHFPIVLQSLFSRAETGLFKNDSAPTMPVTNLKDIANQAMGGKQS